MAGAVGKKARGQRYSAPPPERKPGGGKRAGASFGNRRKGSRTTLRGSAYYSFRNSAFDARPYSLTGQTVAKPSYAWNRMGFTWRTAQDPQADPSPTGRSSSSTTPEPEASSPTAGWARCRRRPSARGDFLASATRVPTAHLRQEFGPALPRQPRTGVDVQPGLARASRFHALAQPARPDSELPVPGALPAEHRQPQHSASTSRCRRGTGSRPAPAWQTRANQQMYLYGWRAATDGGGLQSDVGWTYNLKKGVINSLHWNFTRNRSQTTPHFAFGATSPRNWASRAPRAIRSTTARPTCRSPTSADCRTPRPCCGATRAPPSPNR